MSLQAALRPKEPRNFKATAGICLVILAAYLVAASGGWPWSPKRGLGLVFGFLAALLFLFECIYPLRRPRAWVLGTARSWLQAHVYAGVVALVAVVLHTGFTLPHGWFGWALLLLSVITVFGGLLGVVLQKWLPFSMAQGLRVAALQERIPDLLAALRLEADALMEDASDALENFYRTQVADGLGQLAPSYAYVFDVRGGRERALEPFRRMAQFVGPDEKQKVDDLMAIYTEKLELDATYSVQRVLRNWLTWTVHVPAAGVLLALLAVHVLTWVVY